jgi:uncharacterized membrane protein
MNDWVIGLSVFLAAAVEMVEALTIVLALGISRGWRSTLLGAGAALVTLGVVVAVFGTFLAKVSDESNGHVKLLWLILGALILAFGLQWLRKAILRYSGLLPIKDEDVKYEKVLAAAKKEKRSLVDGIDPYAFVLSFKGVFLEGLEVVFIVLAFSNSTGNVWLAVKASLLALVAVALAGLILHRPLAKIPENGMKFIVGLLLTSFGTFFAAKGVGVLWPYGEKAVFVIALYYLAVSLGLVLLLSLAAGKLNSLSGRLTR